MREIFLLAVVISDKAQRERPPALESSVLSSGEAETVSGREVSRRDRQTVDTEVCMSKWIYSRQSIDFHLEEIDEQIDVPCMDCDLSPFM